MICFFPSILRNYFMKCVIFFDNIPLFVVPNYYYYLCMKYIFDYQ